MRVIIVPCAHHILVQYIEYPMNIPVGDPLVLYRDVLNNPAVRVVGGWKCGNHDEPTDEAQYVAKAEADIEAFSDNIDKALALL